MRSTRDDEAISFATPLPSLPLPLPPRPMEQLTNGRRRSTPLSDPIQLSSTQRNGMKSPSDYFGEVTNGSAVEGSSRDNSAALRRSLPPGAGYAPAKNMRGTRNSEDTNRSTSRDDLADITRLQNGERRSMERQIRHDNDAEIQRNTKSASSNFNPVPLSLSSVPESAKPVPTSRLSLNSRSISGSNIQTQRSPPRPSLPSGILSAPLVPTSRFPALPRLSTSVTRPISAFLHSTSLPLPRASTSSSEIEPQPSPRRNATSPTPRFVEDSFMPTPSINDSYAPREPEPGTGTEVIDTLRDRNSRSSYLPSFVPAPAFSAGDRGPYPPHGNHNNRSSTYSGMTMLRRTSTKSLTKEGGSNDYFVGVGTGQEGVGNYRHSQLLNGVTHALMNGSGKVGKTRDSTLIEERESVQNPMWRASIAVKELPSETNPAVVTTSEPIDMVGIGRNSFIALQSPNHQLSTSPQTIINPASVRPPVNGSSPPPVPPHLPPQPSVCVECMMRDRDMADIDVTGEGIWDGDSDLELREILRHEDEESSTEIGDEMSLRGSEEGRKEEMMMGSRDSFLNYTGGVRTSTSSKPLASSASLHGSSSHHGVGEKRRKIGRGEPVSVASLKLWTNMNPPASSHRHKTLKVFLAETNALLDPKALESQTEAYRRARTVSETGVGRQRASTSFSGRPNVVLDRNEKETFTMNGRTRSRTALPDDLRTTMIGKTPPMPMPGLGREYTAGNQPWLPSASTRRLSSPALKDAGAAAYSSSAPSTPTPGTNYGHARSTTDLRSGGTKEDRRASMWSRFKGATGSTSVLSLAPSGSMMDMHLGLSMDKHAEMRMSNGPYNNYNPTMSDPLIRTWTMEDERSRERVTGMAVLTGTIPREKEKKKGIKGFISKLISVGGDKSSSSPKPQYFHQQQQYYSPSTSAPMTPRSPLNYSDDEYPLAPPPPLSLLVNESRTTRIRTASGASIDSLALPFPSPVTTPHLRGYSASTMVDLDDPVQQYQYPRPALVDRNHHYHHQHHPSSSSYPNATGAGAGDRTSIVTQSESYASARSAVGKMSFEMPAVVSTNSPPRSIVVPPSTSSSSSPFTAAQPSIITQPRLMSHHPISSLPRSQEYNGVSVGDGMIHSLSNGSLNKTLPPPPRPPAAPVSSSSPTSFTSSSLAFLSNAVRPPFTLLTPTVSANNDDEGMMGGGKKSKSKVKKGFSSMTIPFGHGSQGNGNSSSSGNSRKGHSKTSHGGGGGGSEEVMGIVRY